MRRRIHLVGAYAGFHEGPIEVEGATPWDAIEAVTSQLSGFRPDPVAGRKVIQVLGFDSMEALKSAARETVDLYVSPPLMFGKNNGLVQVLIGAALIAVSFIPGIGMGVTLGLGGKLTLGAAFAGAGISMVIGGVIQMISPQPQLSGRNEEEARSKYLSGIQNTVAIGTPIPILYGRRKAGGHLLSLNIDATSTSR